MNKREKLARALYETRDKSEDGKRERVFYAGEWDAQVDAVLDELMEPGDEARMAGFRAALDGRKSRIETEVRLGGKPAWEEDEYLDSWQATLTHIKDGKP